MGGDTIDRLAPVPIPFSTEIVKIAAGWYHSAVVDRQGNVWTFGYNDNGQLGIGSRSDQDLPMRVDVPHAIDISCGQYFTVVNTSQGHLWTFGENGSGQLGLGDTNSRLLPKAVPLTNIVHLSTGETHTLALDEQGTLWAFGSIKSGQLGLGDSRNRLRPTASAFFSNVRCISAGNSYSFVVDGNGYLWSCGDALHGKLGQGSTTRATPFPLQVPSIRLFSFPVKSSRNNDRLCTDLTRESLPTRWWRVRFLSSNRKSGGHSPAPARAK